MALPEPFVPADCDVSSLRSFLFHAQRFRDSNFAATVNPEAGFYAVCLWAAAWQQKPPASLPSDPVQLARLAGLGRDVQTWERHASQALYGFVACSDGRLYHPVLAMRALEAWAWMLGQAVKSARGVEARTGRVVDIAPTLAKLDRAHAAIEYLMRTTGERPESRVFGRPEPAANPRVNPLVNPRDDRGVDPAVNPTVDLLNKTESKEIETKSKSSTARRAAGKGYSEAFLAFWQAYPRKRAQPDAWKAWATGKLDQLADHIIHDVQRRLTEDYQWRKDGGQYIPYPATYLRQQRWKDSFEPIPHGSAERVEDHNLTKARKWAIT